jgi:UDP-glucose 4-epimerase
MKQQRAVVIGGAGFIGSYVVRELLQNKYEVVVIDNLSTGSHDRLPDEVELIIEDVRNYEALLKHIQKDDIIFHLAALVSVPLSLEKPWEAHEINIRGTYNVFEACRVAHVKGIIFSSSASVYGNQEGLVSEMSQAQPETPYGLHKLMGEQLATLYSSCFLIPTVSLRYFNVYGKGHHETGSYAPAIAKFLKQKREGVPVTITGDGLQMRDFVHVRDVARANVASIQLLASPSNTILNVCTGESFSIKDIAEKIHNEITYIPARQEIKRSLGSNEKIMKLLTWKPETSLMDGIKELVEMEK